LELYLKGIKKSFDKKQVLKGIDYRFEKGKIYGLLGRNGAGKTTLFNCLSQEMNCDEGEAVLIKDNIAKTLSDEDVGYVLSTPVLPEFLTGYEFVKFMMDINLPKGSQDKHPDEYFDIVKLEQEDRHRLINGYSHGMKNKLQMLSFIISKPPIILLDEPLTSFDVVVALEMKKLLKEMKADHILIFSTHILQLAVDLCDEIAVLNQGRLSSVDYGRIHSQSFEEEIFSILNEGGNGE